MPVKRYHLLIALTLFFASLLPAGQGTAEASKKIALILSSNIRPFIEALNGIEANLTGDYQVLDCSKNIELVRHYLRSEAFDAAISIGPQATILLYESGVKIPVKLAIMSLDIKKLVKTGNPCGIDLRVPIEFQLRVIRERLGPDRNIGILFNQKENGWLVNRAKETAQSLGLKILPLEVESPTQILARLNPVFSRLDCLLFIPDPVVISEKIITHLTKRALLQGVAIIGFNRFFFDTGALLAFIIDYEKVGREAATLLKQVEHERDCKILPPPVEIRWNKKVFRLLKDARPKRWEILNTGRSKND